MCRGRLALLSTVGLALASASGALADPASPPTWLDSIVFGGHIEAGATLNPAPPDNGVNFGRLFTDKANQAVLNQFALSVEREPRDSGFDLGFRLAGMYGMDSQFTHFLGLGDQGTTARNSFDILEADLAAHLPLLAGRGVEVKAGLFPSPMGFEAIDPTRNLFYSRSYIYDFGLPKKHTGVLATVRPSERLSLILGYTTGVNTSLGYGGGYNDTQPHFLGGFGLDLGRVTLKALAHVGPEDPPSLLPAGINPHRAWRTIGDVVLTWRVSDRLMSISEVNFVRDDGLKAQAGGAAEYLSYALSPKLAAAIRAEVWRDAEGAFVAAYPGNLDYLDAEAGLANGAYRFGPATYGEITVGLRIKTDGLGRILPSDSPLGELTLRPELRYDRVLAGAAPFGGRRGGAKDQFTAGLDVVIPLTFQRPAGERDHFAAEVGDPETQAAAPAKPPAFAASLDTLPRIVIPRSTLVEQAALGPATLDALSGWAPGLMIVRSVMDPAALIASIRGLGDVPPPASLVPGIGVRLDGIALEADLARIVDLSDVAEVAIEPRPGGADYGDTALVGTLALERPRPTRRWGVWFDYGFEQGYHANTEKALLNAPVGDDAGLSLFASHRQRGGYLTNLFTGDDLFGRDEMSSGALQFDWSLTPRLTVNLGVILAHEDGQGAPLSLGDTLDARLAGPAMAAATPGLTFNAYGSPHVPGITIPLGPFQSANDFGDASQLTAQIYSLTMNYDLPRGRLTSTTAYQTLGAFIGADLDGGCVPADAGAAPCPTLVNPFVGFLHAARWRASDRFSEDLTFVHDLGGHATLQAGLSYSRDRDSDRQTTLSAPSGAPVSAMLTDQNWGQTREARSAFAGLTIDFTPRLRLDGQVRYLDETTRYHDKVDTGAASAGSQHRSILLPRAGIDYRLSEALTLYANYATGFRPGGQAAGTTLSEQIPGQTNFDPANPRADDSAYLAETDRTYEIGSKVQAFGGRMMANIAAFITEDRDRQLAQLVRTPGYGPAINTYVANLPKVEIKGVDLQVDVKPRLIPGLTLTGDGAFANARIVDGRIPAAKIAEGPAATAGPAGSTLDLTGSPLTFAPRFSYGLHADYRRPLGPGVVDANVAYRWTDRFALATLAGQGDFQPAYGLLDFSLSYARSFYRISVSGRNLLNRAYLTSAAPALFVHSWGDPRTAAVELQVQF